MRQCLHVFGGVLLVLVFATRPASATDISLNAVSFADIPGNTPVSVEIFDDSEDNLALKKTFEEQLTARGYRVADGARLIMTVETRDTSGKWTGGGSNRLISIGNSQNHTGTDAPDVRVSIFDSQRGGILNPKQDRSTSQVAPSEYRIDATIEDRSNGKMLWQGWSIASIGAIDDPVLHQSMVRPLVENIGKTVRAQELGGN